ncbi:MAG: tyrosine-type recombinase/integrase [Agathobacter sp.]
MVRRKDNKGRVLKDGETYRNSDGLYMYRWTDKLKKRHTVYGKTLEELREKEDKILHDLRDGIRVGESNVTVDDIYEMWKQDKAGLKETTFRNYVYMYEHFIKGEFGSLKIQSIKKSDIRRLYNSLVNENTPKHMSLYTLDSLNTVLHQVFKVAVEDEFIRTNLVDGVLADVRKTHNFDRPKRIALTKAQQERFMEFIHKSPQYKHWEPLFTFFLGTGCRVSEVVGIRWQDISDDFISINHNMVYYSRRNSKCYFAITTPKTHAGMREIPLFSQVRKALEDEKAFQEECEIVCNSRVDGYTGFVFLNRFGNPHNPQTINRAIKRITFAANEEEMELAEKEHREPILIPPFSCHNLRHTFCTRLCEVETNIGTIMKIMGHKDVSTTMGIYNEVQSEFLKEKADTLDKKLKIS